MNSWIKKELRKNPVEHALMEAVNYFNEHRSGIIKGAAVFLIMLLFGMALYKSRARELKEASLLLSSAQADYSQFNYEAAAEKAAGLIKNYPGSSLGDQALYLAGLSYYEMEDTDKACENIKEAIESYSASRIRPEMSLTLGELLETKGENNEALKYYSEVPDDHYLQPEAMYSIARIYEITGDTKAASDVYSRLAAHYPESFWGDFASGRLEVLSPVDAGLVPEPGFREE